MNKFKEDLSKKFNRMKIPELKEHLGKCGTDISNFKKPQLVEECVNLEVAKRRSATLDGYFEKK